MARHVRALHTHTHTPTHPRTHARTHARTHNTLNTRLYGTLAHVSLAKEGVDSVADIVYCGTVRHCEAKGDTYAVISVGSEVGRMALQRRKDTG